MHSLPIEQGRIECLRCHDSCAGARFVPPMLSAMSAIVYLIALIFAWGLRQQFAEFCRDSHEGMRSVMGCTHVYTCILVNLLEDSYLGAPPPPYHPMTLAVIR